MKLFTVYNVLDKVYKYVVSVQLELNAYTSNLNTVLNLF